MSVLMRRKVEIDRAARAGADSPRLGRRWDYDHFVVDVSEIDGDYDLLESDNRPG